MGCPSRLTSPACGVTRPAIDLRSVVLPAPLAPMRATTSPAFTCNDTPCSARTPAPYATWTSRTSSRLAGGTALSQVGADHLLVAHDRLGRAVRDLHAVVEHDDAMGQRHDDLH